MYGLGDTGQFRQLDRAQFLTQHLPMKPSADATSLNEVVSQFPTTFNRAEDMYDPFVEVAHAILDECSGNTPILYSWATRPSHALKGLPGSGLPNFARPDAVNVLGDERPIRRLERALKAYEEAGTQRDRSNTVKAIWEDAYGCAATLRGSTESTVRAFLDNAHFDYEILANGHDIQFSSLKKHVDAANELPGAISGPEYRRSSSWLDPIVLVADVVIRICRGKLVHQEAMNDEMRRMTAQKSQSKNKDTLEAGDLEGAYSVWWHRVGTPVEMRPTFSPESCKEGSAQLARYMELTLRAQPNRRFVFGLLICGDQLLVLRCDRSGMLATDAWIDMHEHFEVFAQVIISLSCLDDQMLGWDDSMHLCLQSRSTPDEMKFCSSTDPSIRLADYGATTDETRWAVRVPVQDGSVGGPWYVTVAPVSVSGEVMVGPATRVWLVKELDESMKRVKPGYDATPIVLKQAWKRIDSELKPPYSAEKDLLGPSAIPHVSNVLRSVQLGIRPVHGDIMVDNTLNARGSIVGTSSLWRNGIPATLVPSKKLSVVRPQRPLFYDSVEGLDSDSDLVSRSMVRTLTKTHGWPIRYSKDLAELVAVVRDAVTGHRDLYLECGVLHRNINEDNILICPVNGDGDVCTGTLIDLDHSKKAESRIPTPSAVSSEDIEKAKIVLRIVLKNAKSTIQGPALKSLCENDILLQQLLWRAEKCYCSVVVFIRAARDFLRRNAEETDLDVADEDVLREIERTIHYPTDDQIKAWMEGRRLPPSWTERSATTSGTRTETIPFTSYEMLYGEGYRYFQGAESISGHTSVHDIESFFWVVLYTALMRKGPGGHRRDEPAGAPFLMAYRLFQSHAGGSGIGANKRRLFHQPRDFEPFVLDQIHPYFCRLKPLLRQWFELLQISHRFNTPVTQAIIHDQLITILNAELDNLKSTAPSQAEEDAEGLMDQELRRREQELFHHSSFPSSSSFPSTMVGVQSKAGTFSSEDRTARTC